MTHPTMPDPQGPPPPPPRPSVPFRSGTAAVRCIDDTVVAYCGPVYSYRDGRMWAVWPR